MRIIGQDTFISRGNGTGRDGTGSRRGTYHDIYWLKQVGAKIYEAEFIKRFRGRKKLSSRKNERRHFPSRSRTTVNQFKTDYILLRKICVEFVLLHFVFSTLKFSKKE